MNGDKGPCCGETEEVMGEISQTGMKCNLDGGQTRGERFQGNQRKHLSFAKETSAPVRIMRVAAC